MRWLVASTLIFWFLSGWLLLSAFRNPGFVRRLRRLVAALVCGGLGVLMVALLLVLQAFTAFSGETPIARVTTRRLSPEEFELTYQPVGAAAATAMTVHLRGDQWAMSGGIVKWHPWLTALGLQSYQKPLWLSGQFSRLELQRTRLPTIYSLASMDWYWETLYWASRHLPFIEAVYGSSAYVYVEPEAVQEIDVTPAGYLIKRSR